MADDEAVQTDTPVPGGWTGRAFKAAAVLVIGALVLVGLLIAGLDTGPGHRLVADRIAALAFENGMAIRVGRIEGSIYGKMTLHDLSVRDPQGEFLYAPVIDVDWRPFSYIGNHVDVRSAVAPRMVLRRVPQFRVTAPSSAPLLPDMDIDIGTLRVDRFLAEKPVTGSPRLLALSGNAHIANRRAQVQFDGRTIGGGGRAGGDRLHLVLDAVPEKNRLALNLAVDAPGNGVIAALMGISDPVTVRASGNGDWRAWNGRLDAKMAGSELGRLALTGRQGTFTVRGPTRIARLFNGATASLLGPVTRLDLTARLDQRRAALSGVITSDALALTPSGTLDFTDNSFDELRFAGTLLRPSALAPNLAGSGLRGIFTLNGPFARPRVVYALSADRLAMNDMGIERLAATGEAVVDADHILIPLKASAARITGVDTVAGGTLLNVRLDGDLAIKNARVLSDNMRLRSDRIDAGLVLAADLGTGLYTGAINGRIDNYRVDSVGVFVLDTRMDLKTEPTGFALAGKVRARSKRITNSGVADFLGGQMVASSDLRYGTDGMVRFANLRLEAPLLRVTGGQGTYSPDGRIAITANALSRRYGRVGISVAGTVANPNAVVMAERPGLGIGLANLRAKVTGARGGYRLAATGDTDYGPLTAEVVLGTGKQTTLQIERANLGGIDLAGSLHPTSAGPYAGTLTASGNGLAGVVTLSAAGRYQAVDAHLRARDTVLPGPAQLGIGSAIVDARVVLYDRPWVVADVQLAGTHIGAFDLAAARAVIDYRDGTGTAKALVEGTSGVPFRVAVNADLQPRLWTAAVSGRARGVAFKTAGPARIVPHRGGYELLPTRIDFGQGNMRLAGRYGPGLRIESRLDRMDLALLNAFVPGYGIGGSATGSLDFTQASSEAFPRADARLSITRFTRTSAAVVSEPVDVNLVGSLRPDGGELRAVFRERGSVIGRMNTSLRPLGPGAGRWTTRLLAAPLGGGLRYNGPAETLFSLTGLNDQRLSGPVGVAADFSCRVVEPCLKGVIRSQAMTYENLTYGTRLRNLAVSGRFSGERLEIERLTATAGDGTVAARGTISLAAASGYPMDLAITLDNARLARSDAISARATGNLRLTKSEGEAALLSGALRLPETRYKIVREGAAQVPELTGVRFKPPRGPRRVTGDEPAVPAPGLFRSLRLDLTLDAPEKLYVTGMGLDSEWRARFRVGGTSAAPGLTGEVTLLRGNLDFAGRSFELGQGRVLFTGGPVADPTINLTASDDVEDVTVNVTITGRSSNPQISFSSVPGLPQDEIMSRILFGSSIANLQTLQAVQLASSLNTLRGSGGGLNPLCKLRSAAGIDRLRILGPDEASGRGTALAAGQYITDDIYVEVITDARGFTATQLEIALTKWLSLLSQAGGSGVNNVSARIKKDY